MVVFPNAKINLGLRILRKRPDGYHDLETVFYPVPLCDVLEIIPSSSAEPVQFTGSGLSISGNPDENLCIKALQLLRKDFPDLPSVQLHLHKHIPMGAGLGGGSSDAAFTLQLMNNRFALGLSPAQLHSYALQLGSDCPFFLENVPCIATGRGEVLEKIQLSLSSFKILLVNPGIHVSTAAAFSELIPSVPDQSVRDIIHQPVQYWKEHLVNDFEIPVFSRHPPIAAIKDQLYAAGAQYASMSGSGSTVFGLFPENWNNNLVFPSNYFVTELRSQTK